MAGWLERGGARVPFTLLGGYLGSGKTTVVNHVLAHAGGRRIVVLVNDVGAVNVDAALIADHDGPTLTLTNGCVCCALDDDFTTTLEAVRGLAVRPDHVLMELSGVGEPARLVAWAGTTGFRFDGVAVTIDLDQFVEQSERRYVGETVLEQVRSADLLLLTKGDLVDESTAGRVGQRLAALTAAPTVPAAFGAVPTDVLLGIGASPARHLLHTRATAVDTRTVDLSGVDVAGLGALLDALPPRAVRAKGLVTIAGTVHEVQLVGRRRSIRPRPDLPAEAADGTLVVIELPG